MDELMLEMEAQNILDESNANSHFFSVEEEAEYDLDNLGIVTLNNLIN